jgi:RNA polymerase sigma-70 factor (ECF subfamily)
LANVGDLPFAELIRRVRTGDHLAAEEIVRQFEPLVRRELRVSIARSPIGRLVDSVDVAQSVWSSFFLRMGVGEYDVNDPKQLAALLLSMARHKLSNQLQRHRRKKRDLNRLQSQPAMEHVSDNQPSPSEMTSVKELAGKLNEMLSDEERQISRLREQGCTWDEIARQVGGTAQARRMQMTRAADRIAEALGLE